jgi:hypothetical protein
VRRRPVDGLAQLQLVLADVGRLGRDLRLELVLNFRDRRGQLGAQLAGVGADRDLGVDGAGQRVGLALHLCAERSGQRVQLDGQLRRLRARRQLVRDRLGVDLRLDRHLDRLLADPVADHLVEVEGLELALELGAELLREAPRRRDDADVRGADLYRAAGLFVSHEIPRPARCGPCVSGGRRTHGGASRRGSGRLIGWGRLPLPPERCQFAAMRTSTTVASRCSEVPHRAASPCRATPSGEFSGRCRR